MANEYTTLCDYDYQLPPDMRQRVRAVSRLLGLKTTYRRLDRTAKGFHLILRWDTSLDPLTTVCIQAILGSDAMRECLNLMRARAKPSGTAESQYWNLLYERKHTLTG